MKERWLMGDAGSSVAPANWNASLGTPKNAPTKTHPGDETELGLLAIAGQYQALVRRPPTPSLCPRPLVPPLGFPTLAGRARTLFSRSIELSRLHTNSILALMAARGYAAHPLDWLPSSPREEVPDIYHPWLVWLLSPNEDGPKELSAENWDDVHATLRRVLLKQQLRTDRSATLGLIKDCTAYLPANEREEILRLLEPDPQPDALVCLRAFEKDRSSKVRALVRKILASMGESCTEDPAPSNDKRETHFQELLGMLKQDKHGIGPKRFPKEKRAKLEARLWSADPRRLAKHFDLTPLQLAKAWQYDRDAKASSSLLHAYLDRDMVKDAMPLLRHVARSGEGTSCNYILPRLNPKQHDTLIRIAVEREDASFVGLDRWLGESPGTLSFDLAKKSPAYADLMDCVARDVSTGKDDYSVDTVIQQLGLLLDHQGAIACLDALKQAKFNPLAECLAVLQLNAALPPTPNR